MEDDKLDPKMWKKYDFNRKQKIEEKPIRIVKGRCMLCKHKGKMELLNSNETMGLCRCMECGILNMLRRG